MTLGFFNQIQIGIYSYSSGFLRRPQNFDKISQLIEQWRRHLEITSILPGLIGKSKPDISPTFCHCAPLNYSLWWRTAATFYREDRIGGSRSVPHFHLILHEKYQMQCALRLHKLLFLFCFSYVLLWWWCWNYQRLQEFNRWIVKGFSWL